MLFCLAVTDKSELWFCASVCARSAHGTCQSLGDEGLIDLIAEGKHTACITVSHTQGEEKVAIPAIRQILLNARTPAACIKTNKDRGRHKDTDTYARMQGPGAAPGYILLRQCSDAFK